MSARKAPIRATVLFLLLAALSCCSLVEGRQIAERAVERFHAQLDAGNLDEIYGDTTVESRSRTSREEFVRQLGAVRTKYGSIQSTMEVDFDVVGTASGTKARLVYRTRFAEGAADEYFFWTIKDSKAQLDAYEVKDVR